VVGWAGLDVWQQAGFELVGGADVVQQALARSVCGAVIFRFINDAYGAGAEELQYFENYFTGEDSPRSEPGARIKNLPDLFWVYIGGRD
jgi:hypothetical protein